MTTHTKQDVLRRLVELGACKPAIRKFHGRTLKEVFDYSLDLRQDWLFWLAARLSVSEFQAIRDIGLQLEMQLRSASDWEVVEYVLRPQLVQARQNQWAWVESQTLEDWMRYLFDEQQ